MTSEMQLMEIRLKRQKSEKFKAICTRELWKLRTVQMLLLFRGKNRPQTQSQYIPGDGPSAEGGKSSRSQLFQECPCQLLPSLTRGRVQQRAVGTTAPATSGGEGGS